MRVLVVDDEDHIRELFEDALRDLTDVQVTCERSGFRAMKRVSEQPFDLIFMDIMMPGLNGLQTIDEVRRIRPDTSIAMMSAHATQAIFDEALAKGAESCMSKPFGPKEIRGAVERAREQPGSEG